MNVDLSREDARDIGMGLRYAVALQLEPEDRERFYNLISRIALAEARMRETPLPRWVREQGF
jgi:hypothetical protein